MLELRDIRDLIPFLNFLKSRRVYYTVEDMSFQSVTVLVHLIGRKIEVDFLEDRVEYSIFTGDESVLDDHKALYDMIVELST